VPAVGVYDAFFNVAVDSLGTIRGQTRPGVPGFTRKADSEMSDNKAVIVGLIYYQGVKLSPPYTEWFDDLVIDDTQIGCK
jgi:hypothetical protein